jgi:hypothetical protein
MKHIAISTKDRRTGMRKSLAVCLAFALLLIASSAAALQSSADLQDGLSKEFTQSATTAMIAIHQAKQNIANVVANNRPSGYYNPNLAAQAYDQVRQSQIVARTSGDQQAATLLNSYLTKVKTWAEQYKADRQSLNATNTIGENTLAQDSDWQAIESCEKAFNEMLIVRKYSDIRSCQ